MPNRPTNATSTCRTSCATTSPRAVVPCGNHRRQVPAPHRCAHWRSRRPWRGRSVGGLSASGDGAPPVIPWRIYESLQTGLAGATTSKTTRPIDTPTRRRRRLWRVPQIFGLVASPAAPGLSNERPTTSPRA
jgi:hypothetical protein